jgi:hypothetical protein
MSAQRVHWAAHKAQIVKQPIANPEHSQASQNALASCRLWVVGQAMALAADLTVNHLAVFYQRCLAIVTWKICLTVVGRMHLGGCTKAQAVIVS